MACFADVLRSDSNPALEQVFETNRIQAYSDLGLYVLGTVPEFDALVAAWAIMGKLDELEYYWDCWYCQHDFDTDNYDLTQNENVAGAMADCEADICVVPLGVVLFNPYLIMTSPQGNDDYDLDEDGYCDFTRLECMRDFLNDSRDADLVGTFRANGKQARLDLGDYLVETSYVGDHLIAAWIMMGFTDIVEQFFQACTTCAGDYALARYDLSQNDAVAEALTDCRVFACTGVDGAQAADRNGDPVISLSKLLRVIQFYNALGLHCAEQPFDTEDGYHPGPGVNRDCYSHSTDYAPRNWVISLSELLRLIQFYNAQTYHKCPDANTEDGLCPGPA